MGRRNGALIAAYLLDGQGSGKKLDWEAVNAWQPSDGLLWVHLDYTALVAKTWLSQHTQLKKHIQKSLLVDESRPRAEVDSDGILLFLRGVNLNPNQDTEDMVSIRIWADKTKIITSRKRPLLSVQDLQDMINKKQGPKTSSEFIAMLSDHLTNRIADAVDKINDNFDDVEEHADTEQISQIRKNISELRRQSIMIRRYLSPQRDALNRLTIDQSGFFAQSDLVQIREATDRVQRYIEDLDSVRDRAAVIQEEISTKLSEQINGRMYVLSMVAVIFLPLSFIAGLLGVNLGGIPGAQNKYAFLILIGLLLLLSFFMFFVFRWKKWI